MPLNWSTAKCRRRKSSDTLCNIVICATLCVTNVFLKHILKSKARNKLIQARKKIILSLDSKELFVQRFAYILDQVRKHVKAPNQITNTLADFTVLW